MASFLFSAPYIARIILSLLGILVFQRLTKRLDLAMLCGVVVLAAWTGQTPAGAVDIALERFLSPDTFFLAFVIAGVIWLSSFMSEAGLMSDLVLCLKARLSSRALLAALPAVVGLLPMPAGAYFSAPLLDDADGEGALGPDLKSNINYWFRHVWEFWWPLYPGVLLAVDMSGVPVWFFAAVMSPLFLFSLMVGYAFFLRRVPDRPAQGGEGRGKPFLPLVLPVLTVIGVYGALLAVAPGLAAANKYLPMAIGVVMGIAVMQWRHPAGAAVWKRVILSRRALALVLLIVLARVYGAFIEARLPDGTQLMDAVRLELHRFGIPALFLAAVIPFVSGLTTGIAVGFVGASFPVVLSLAGAGDYGLYATMILGYASGFLGMMLSPIHACLIVTNEYFGTRLARSLRKIVLPCLVLFLCALLYSRLWSWLEAV